MIKKGYDKKIWELRKNRKEENAKCSEKSRMNRNHCDNGNPTFQFSQSSFLSDKNKNVSERIDIVRVESNC